MKIEISELTLERLEKMAIGFDTPEGVITRLLDLAENKKEIKPDLVFNPGDENRFKSLLIKDKLAEVIIYKNDSTREVTQWNANKFNEKSSLRGNLWSGFLRDWKSKGIAKIELTIYPKPTIHDDIDTFQQKKRLAIALNLTFSEVLPLDFEVIENTNNGFVYDYTVRFYSNCDRNTLSKIKGLSNDDAITLPAFTFD